MLTLTRRATEALSIGEDVEVVVLSVARGRVRLGIKAPRAVAIHRKELVAEVGRAMRSAILLAPDVEPPIAEGAKVIELPRGLLGLSGERRHVLSAIDDSDTQWVLASLDTPGVELLVVEAIDVLPSYPADEARKLAVELVPELEFEESAVAVIARVPVDGSAATVNLAAPIVIGLASRKGAQVILDRPDLGVTHTLVPAEVVGLVGGEESET